MMNEYLDKKMINLADISKVKSYKDVFLSHQWVQAFQAIYEPVNIECISCNHISVCYCLHENGTMIAVGDPFNDFNDVCSCPEFVSSLKNVCHRCSIFISNSETLLTAGNITETECYKTLLENYEEKISNRIHRQYIDTQMEVAYRQIPASHPDFTKYLLWLLGNRQRHLTESRPEESNDSYHDNFNDLIIEFCSNSGHCDTIRLDILESVNSSELLAMSLNFYAPDGVMCYLRACARNTPRPMSYGLILDLHVMKEAKQNKYPVYDLTRGGEAYKLRLGTEKYMLFNQQIENSTPF